METWILALVVACAAIFFARGFFRRLFVRAYTYRARRRLLFVTNYVLPPGLREKFAEKHPELNDEQIDEVFLGLRDYFLMCAQMPGHMISMPSKIVDDAWHEFILYTRDYEQFCQKAFGTFLHHTPAEAMDAPEDAREGLRRAWRLACQKYNINAENPARLPTLFAIDRKLNVEKGNYYTLEEEQKGYDSNGIRQPVFNARAIGCVAVFGAGMMAGSIHSEGYYLNANFLGGSAYAGGDHHGTDMGGGDIGGGCGGCGSG